MRTRQERVATDTRRSPGRRTTPLEHWSKRKPTVEPRWAKQPRYLLVRQHEHIMVDQRMQSIVFKSFVANRVGEIQSSTHPEQCRYVPTRSNPADLLSRGMRAGELRDCGSWWRGPEFLMASEETWLTEKVIGKPTENDELKRSTGNQLKSKAEPNGTNGYTHAVEEAHPVFVTTVDNDATFTIDACQYSSWLRLRRVLA